MKKGIENVIREGKKKEKKKKEKRERRKVRRRNRRINGNNKGEARECGVYKGIAPEEEEEEEEWDQSPKEVQN